MTINDNDWITVNDAAKLSGYHPEHLRRLIRENAIKARKISIIWLVERDSLLAYIEKANSTGDGRYSPRGNKP